MQKGKLAVALAVAVLCLGSGLAVGATPKPVKVTGGKVLGVEQDGLVVYKGIPFAAPPVGGLRWKAPQPVTAWQGVLKAEQFQAAAPQRPSDNFWSSIDNRIGKQAEDCLYLNIWAPEKPKKKLPVMVWIHGGGFTMGSSHQPNWTGEELARQDVVFVRTAYRLGALGFLAHPALSKEAGGLSGNYGLMDQLAGLQWIQKNISKFGGDPQNVTIFGESAGGISVAMLCASPEAKGLFQKAISESGGAMGPVEEKRTFGIPSLKAAEQGGLAFAKRMGANTLEELRQVPAEKMVADPATEMGVLFWPVVDGKIIAGDPYTRYQQGLYNDVAVMVGSNSNEGMLFLPNTISQATYLRYLDSFGAVKNTVLQFYPARTDAQATQSMRDIFQDSTFEWPTYAWANLQSRSGKAPVYRYYFDQTEPRHNSPLIFRGAAHSDEINYVFGHVDNNVNFHYSKEDKALSRLMQDYWVNFARTGNPNGKGLPIWPQYKAGTDTVMYLNSADPKAGPSPDAARMSFWDNFFAGLRAK